MSSRRALALTVAGAAGAALLIGASAGSARAHPHVWINDVTIFVFEGTSLVAIQHHWTFDEFFSAFVLEEQDRDHDGSLSAAEIEAVRAEAFASLADFGYFTHLRIDGEHVPLTTVEHFDATVRDGLLTYRFTLSLPDPVDPASHALEVGVFDPEYYVEVLPDQDDPVRFAGIPSGACVFDIREDEEHPIYYGMIYPSVVRLECATS